MADINLSQIIGNQSDQSSSAGMNPDTAVSLYNLIHGGQASSQSANPGLTQLGATFAGAKQGFDMYASSLYKLAARYGLTGGTSQKAFQDTYDQEYKDFQTAKSKYPVSSVLGSMAGGMLALAPTTIFPGGIEGAGVSSIGQAGKLAANALYQAGQGYLAGGLANQPGQDSNQVVNQGQGAVGAVLGGMIGTPLNTVGTNWANRTSELEAAQDAAKAAGYKGRVMEIDLPSNGIYDTVKKWAANNILGKLPGPLGINGVRQEQSNALHDAMSEYLGNIATDSRATGPVQIGKILDNHAQELSATQNDLWNTFSRDPAVQNQAVAIRSAQPQLDAIKSTIEDPASGINSILTKKERDLLSDPAMQSGYATPQQIIDYKRNVWPIYTKLQKTVNNGQAKTAVESDLADNLRNVYWNSIQDMKDGLNLVPGDTSSAVQKFEAANEYTKNLKTLMDPKDQPKLINAIEGASNNASDVSDFVNALRSPNTSYQQLQQYNKVLGQTGRQAVGNYVINDTLQQSLDNIGGTNVLNVNKFLGAVNKYQKTTPAQSGMYYQPTLDSMNGLMKIAQNISDSGYAPQAGSDALGNIVKSVGAGAVGAAGLTGGLAGAGGLVATPAALSAIVKYSPLKSGLIRINKLVGDGKVISGSAEDWLIQHVIGNLTNAGVLLDQASGDHTIIHHVSDGLRDSARAITPSGSNQDIPSPTATTGIRD